MQELIAYMARALVDAPDAVTVRETNPGHDGAHRIILQVAPDDRGKVIGKKGRMAHTMRILLNAAAGAEGPIGLDIVD